MSSNSQSFTVHYPSCRLSLCDCNPHKECIHSNCICTPIRNACYEQFLRTENRVTEVLDGYAVLRDKRTKARKQIIAAIQESYL